MVNGCHRHREHTEECAACVLTARIRGLEAQLATARRDALEEAAKVAEDSRNLLGCKGIAHAIRALQSTPSPRLYTEEQIEAAMDASHALVYGAISGGVFLEDRFLDALYGKEAPARRRFTLEQVERALKEAYESTEDFRNEGELFGFFLAALEGK